MRRRRRRTRWNPGKWGGAHWEQTRDYRERARLIRACGRRHRAREQPVLSSPAPRQKARKPRIGLQLPRGVLCFERADMYAVIKTGDKQYKVAAGEKIKVEQIAA